MKFAVCFVVAVICGLHAVSAIDNGLGVKPPMGWRSWNLYGANVDQKLIEGIMDGMVKRTRMVDGKLTSLLDLGYKTVGLDDNWQLCGKYGPQQYTYHNNGSPVVNTGRFPDMKSMTDYAHSLGLKAGWYGNNCICSDHCSTTDCYQGDVTALIAFGFDAVKLDGCGAQRDLDLWSSLINKTGKAIEIENCHWGGTIPNATWCPWNFYRSSGDVRANFGSILGNLHTTIPLAAKNLSTPGCWAYPDMLEVGCAAGPGGRSDSGLSIEETRSHFGGWAIVSSPLTLSHDVNNETMTDFIWPIIANPEALAVNQEYYGFSGTSFKSGGGVKPEVGNFVLAVQCDNTDTTQFGWTFNPSQGAIMFKGQCVDSAQNDQLMLATCSGSATQKFAYQNTSKFNTFTQNGQCIDVWEGNGAPGGPAVEMYSCHSGANQEFAVANNRIWYQDTNSELLCLSARKSMPGVSYESYYKPMSWDGSKAAVLLMNTSPDVQDIAVNFADVPGLKGTTCSVRNIWTRTDLGSFSNTYTASQVASHDSAFLLLTCN